MKVFRFVRIPLLVVLTILLAPKTDAYSQVTTPAQEGPDIRFAVSTCIPDVFEKSSDCDFDLWRFEANWYFDLSGNGRSAQGYRALPRGSNSGLLPFQFANNGRTKGGIGIALESDQKNSIPPPEDGGGPVALLKDNNLTPAANFRDEHVSGVNHEGFNSILAQLILQIPVFQNDGRLSVSVNPTLGGGISTLKGGTPSVGVAGVDRDGAFPSLFFGGALTISGFLKGDAPLVNQGTTLKIYLQNMVHYPGELIYSFVQGDLGTAFPTNPLTLDVDAIRKVNLFIGFEFPLNSL